MGGRFFVILPMKFALNMLKKVKPLYLKICLLFIKLNCFRIDDYYNRMEHPSLKSYFFIINFDFIWKDKWDNPLFNLRES